MNIVKNRIGKTEVEVTSLSFGGASIGNLGVEVAEEDAQAVMAHAWDAGLRYFDTAPHYGRGLSEVRIGKFLQEKPRGDYVISTKVGRVLTPGKQQDEAQGFVKPLPNDVHYDYSADGILESFEGSCERLKNSKIDIIYVHDIGEYTHGAADGSKHMADLLGSGMRALRDLKQQGRIGAIGLGVNETQVCLDIMKEERLDAILLAGRLTLMDRGAESGLLDLCRDHETSLVLGGIFNSGILATGPVTGASFDYGPAPQDVLDRVSELQEHAQSVGLTLAEAAMQFAIRHPAAASVLLGTGKIRSLQRNLDAVQIPMSQAAMDFVTT